MTMEEQMYTGYYEKMYRSDEILQVVGHRSFC